MREREMVASETIKASPQRVWEALTDLSSYPEWNPMIRWAKGEIREGATLEVRFHPKGRRRGRTFHPRLRVVEPGKELRWSGRDRVPWLFDFEHYWIMEPEPEAGTIFRHGTVIRGLIAPMLAPQLKRMSHGPFQNMNRAHRDRTEGG
ncbi:MAG: SRPBCC family protein [Actinomycetota bacterium]